MILFEILSGRLPFEGLPHEILYRKQHGRPPRVAALAPGVPPDLAALCDRLLEPDPENAADRVRGAGGAGAHARPTGARSVAPRDESAAGRGPRPRAAVLAAALDAVRSGQGARLLVVRGESGVGKSALVAAFLRRFDPDAAADDPNLDDDAFTQRAPPLLLTARCYERELVPFKAFDGLVDALTNVLRQLDADTLSAGDPRSGRRPAAGVPGAGARPA